MLVRGCWSALHEAAAATSCWLEQAEPPRLQCTRFDGRLGAQGGGEGGFKRAVRCIHICRTQNEQDKHNRRHRRHRWHARVRTRLGQDRFRIVKPCPNNTSKLKKGGGRGCLSKTNLETLRVNECISIYSKAFQGLAPCDSDALLLASAEAGAPLANPSLVAVCKSTPEHQTTKARSRQQDVCQHTHW